MLYLDASLLIKRYGKEKGSRALNARFERRETIYTSVLSFGEVHAALARTYRMKEVNARELLRLREAFESDWQIGLSTLDMNLHAMIALPKLVDQYPLKAADAIHVSTAFWLKDTIGLRTGGARAGEYVEFGVADRRLGLIAQKCGLGVFNPEDED
jgi:predicted nucleic acid-binding protein